MLLFSNILLFILNIINICYLLFYFSIILLIVNNIILFIFIYFL
jgi:hypothetical protein